MAQGPLRAAAVRGQPRRPGISFHAHHQPERGDPRVLGGRQGACTELMHVQPRATGPCSALRVCAWIVRTQGTYAVSLQMNIVVLFNLLFWYTLDSCEPKDSLLVNCTPPVDGAMECENAVDCVFTPGEAGSCNHRSAIGDSATPFREVECLALDPPGDWSPPTHGEFVFHRHIYTCSNVVAAVHARL